MSTSMIANCLPSVGSEPAFLSLGSINRIGEAFCQSPHNPQSINEIQRYRSFRMHCLETTLAILDRCGVPEQAVVSVRLKRLDSIRRKINRGDRNFKLGGLDDVVGVRVICKDLLTVKKLSNSIKNSPHSRSCPKDYINSPQSTGYRGIHHIMKFCQSVSQTAGINVRFEIQVRTYLQHLWAVWSESKGEQVKAGKGSREEQERLRVISSKIAQWEKNNPKEFPFPSQPRLPPYSGGQSIIVCWKSRQSRMILQPFRQEVQEAVNWLNHLENQYPSNRENALLLIGVTKIDDAERLLRLTHPKFTGAPVPEPEHWMP